MRLLIAAVLLMCSCEARAATWVRADLYYIPWIAETFVALPPQAVREWASSGTTGRVIHITSAQRLQELLNILQLSRLRPERGCSQDWRLVVDLFASDGTRLSVGSSHGSALCMLDNLSSHRTGNRFRNYFERLAP